MATQRQFHKADWLRLILLLAILSTHFWFPDLGDDTSQGTESTSAPGKKALFLALERADIDVERSQLKLEDVKNQIGTQATFCLLGSARYPTEEEWNSLLSWVSQGGTIVIAASPNNTDSLEIPQLSTRLVKVNDDLSDDELSNQLNRKTNIPDNEDKKEDKAAPIKTTLISKGDVYWRETDLTIKAKANAKTLITQKGADQATAIRFGSGEVVVVASDFVFTNEGLLWSGNQQLAYKLVTTSGNAGGWPIYFDETLNGTETPQVVGLMLSPEMQGFTIQIFMGILLFSWWNSRRFGSFLPPSDIDRHNIVDHTNALGVHYYRAGFFQEILTSYLNGLKIDLHWHSKTVKDESRLASLASRLGMSVDELRATMTRAEKLSLASKLDRATAADTIRELALIRNKLE